MYVHSNNSKFIDVDCDAHGENVKSFRLSFPNPNLRVNARSDGKPQRKEET
jgi:hypothetical protein